MVLVELCKGFLECTVLKFCSYKETAWSLFHVKVFANNYWHKQNFEESVQHNITFIFNVVLKQLMVSWNSVFYWKRGFITMWKRSKAMTGTMACKTYVNVISNKICFYGVHSQYR